MISLTDLKIAVSYNDETGVFTRLVSSGGVRAGEAAGSVKSNGYVYLSIAGKQHLAHRLAWFMVNGVWPENDIDHINGDRTDNRFCNLRLATRAENMQNERKARVSNKSSGLLGVSWSKAACKWAAGIKLEGKKKHLGLFDDPQVAHEAYLSEKRKIHDFCTI